MILVYPQLGNSLIEAQYKLYAIFYLVVLPALIMPQTQPMFVHNVSGVCKILPEGTADSTTPQRETFHRESSSKMYSSSVFGLAQIIAEMPYSLLCAVVFFFLFCESSEGALVFPVDSYELETDPPLSRRSSQTIPSASTWLLIALDMPVSAKCTLRSL